MHIPSDQSFLLSLKHISRVFRQGEEDVHVLKSIDLSLKSGECIALLGPSGSGKTTLLQIAGLLDTPTSGEIRIKQESIGISDKERTYVRQKYIGFIYQFHYLLPEFSAFENVVLPQRIGGFSKISSIEYAKYLLSILGLEHRMNHRPAKLSGGEQQRVAIARALSTRPKILLADEPTGNLDDTTADIVFDEMMELVKEKGLAAIIATHNTRLAAKADRILFMEGGMLKEYGAS